MPRLVSAPSVSSGPDDGGSLPLTAAALFAIIWDELADVLGTAAVAAIVRRAAGRAEARSPELAGLTIVRDRLEYRYVLPGAWSQGAEHGLIALRALVAEIGRLLVELTGTVVVRLLEELPELRACRLVWREEEAN